LIVRLPKQQSALSPFDHTLISGTPKTERLTVATGNTKFVHTTTTNHLTNIISDNYQTVDDNKASCAWIFRYKILLKISSNVGRLVMLVLSTDIVTTDDQWTKPLALITGVKGAEVNIGDSIDNLHQFWEILRNLEHF